MKTTDSLRISLLLLLAGMFAACESESDTKNNAGVDTDAAAEAPSDDAGHTGHDAGLGTVTHVAVLNGAQEIPPVDDPASGTAEFSLDGMMLAYRITHDVPSPTAAHIHIGHAGENGGVLHTLTPLGPTMTGTLELSAEEVTALNAGRLYVNIHDAANMGGIIRGQILKPGEKLYVGRLSGNQENPPVTTANTGSIALVLNADETSVHYDLTTTATPAAAHLHKAPAGSNGDVVYTLAPPGKTISGDQAFTAADVANLKAGLLYANVHTTDHEGGELRAQILKPGDRLFRAVLTGDEEVPPVTTTATGSLQLVLSSDKTSATYESVFTGVTATGAHIHKAAAGATGDVVYPLTIDGMRLSGDLTLTAGNLTDLEADNWYVNIHSEANPGGEIRGQLLEVE